MFCIYNLIQGFISHSTNGLQIKTKTMKDENVFAIKALLNIRVL